MKLTSLSGCAEGAARIYKSDTPGAKPDLVDLGLESLRATVGGVFTGNVVVIGAATNVGKSSLALEMLHNSHHRGVLISREDDMDLVGARVLARRASVPEVAIRTNTMTVQQRAAVNQARCLLEAEERRGEGALVALPGQCYTMDMVRERLNEASAQGARYAICDFLQKWRGLSDNRRAEVGMVMDQFQTGCRERGMVAVILSQLGRLGPFARPKIGDLKESGDIENEAKLILLARRNSASPSQVIVEVAKSSFGGGGTQFTLRYNEHGTLEEEGLLTQLDEYQPPADGDKEDF